MRKLLCLLLLLFSCLFVGCTEKEYDGKKIKSIECVKWFTSARVFFDPAHGIYSSTAATPLKTPAINAMMKGNDYQQEFDAVKDTFETNFKRIFSN